MVFLSAKLVKVGMVFKPFKIKLLQNCSPFYKSRFNRLPKAMTPWCLLDPRRSKSTYIKLISKNRNWRVPSSLEDAKFNIWADRSNKAKMLFWRTR